MTYRLEDPPRPTRKVHPLGIMHSIVAAAASPSDSRAHHITKLVTIGFYFCLRSCKYTTCTGHHRTVQFRPLMYFVFFVGDFLLPGDAPVKFFCQTTQIVITLNNKRNTIRGETLSQCCSDSAVACPVKAGIGIFLRLHNRGSDSTTPISDFPSNHGFLFVSVSNIIDVIGAECLRVGATRIGFNPEDVRAHSLCSGGAIDMHIAYVPDWILILLADGGH